MIELLQRTLDGLMEAGPYALVGLGLTLGFGTLRRVNLAYGAGAMLAAYAGAWLHARYAVPAPLVLLVVLGVAALVGLYVEWLCFPGARGVDRGEERGARIGLSTDGREVAALAASFAVWMQLEQLSVAILPHHLNAFPALGATREWNWGPLALRPDRLLQLGLAVLLVAVLWHLLYRSRAGLAWRAVAAQATAAHLVGIAVPQVQRLAFVATSALAGLAACVVLAVDGQVTPMFGMWMLVKGLVAAMLGGLGSVRGVLIGAVVLGVVEAHAQALLGPMGRDATAWVLLLAALIWRSHRASDRQGEPVHA
jgi:branched-chain amino acid transport system permease protein